MLCIAWGSSRLSYRGGLGGVYKGGGMEGGAVFLGFDECAIFASFLANG